MRFEPRSRESTSVQRRK